MPFVLVILGVVLLVAAIRNTQSDLYNLIKGDFTGPSNFIFWTISILFIGALGYIPKLKGLSTAFLGLVVLVLVLTKGNPSSAGGGFFAKFTQGIGATSIPFQQQTAQSPITIGNQATASSIPVIQGPPVDLSLPENLFPTIQ